jgi:DNA-directed RNA polymerase specialized sigma24 family protein
MSDSAPITVWLEQLKAGDAAAAQPLWERYFSRLVALARARLGGTPRAVADEEDVALSAFDSFCRGAECGRFPRLDDRDDLWQLLVMLTVRKAINLARHEGRQKRGGARHASELSDQDVFAQAPGAEPTPAFAAQVAEECRRLLELLDSGELRSVALWKMEGHTNAEIAVKLGRSEGTVERKLALIRKCWEAEGWA